MTLARKARKEFLIGQSSRSHARDISPTISGWLLVTICRCISTAGEWSAEHITVDDDNDAGAAASQRLGSWSIGSTGRCDVRLGGMGSSRSAGDIHQLTARHVVASTSSHGRGATSSAAGGGTEMSLRLSGCGAERSVKAKRRVIKVYTVVSITVVQLTLLAAGSLAASLDNQ